MLWNVPENQVPICIITPCISFISKFKFKIQCVHTSSIDSVDHGYVFMFNIGEVKDCVNEMVIHIDIVKAAVSQNSVLSTYIYIYVLVKSSFLEGILSWAQDVLCI